MASTRDDILEVASALFIEQGYEKTSFREVAEGVGVTKAALYYHFPSKLEILEALVAPAFGVLNDMLAQWDPTRDDLASWETAVASMVDWMLAHQELFVLVDRNIEVIETLVQSSGDFAPHAEMHRRVEALLADATAPAEHRIRVVCALGAATAIFTLGGRAPNDVPLDVVRAVLLDVVGGILRPTEPTTSP